MRHILTIVGARPQFIKASVISNLIRNEFKDSLSEVIVHTGQHFDDKMSKVFFEELHIPMPNYNLGIHSMPHGAMTGRMLNGIEEVMILDKPDLALIYGDTNSTLAGAIAASKLNIPVAHIEAGERSFDRRMPEEVNRVLSDCVSTYLFCSSQNAIDNLKKEGITKNIFLVGDVMLDSFIKYGDLASKVDTLKRLKVTNPYVLLTLHRQETTNDIDKLMIALEAIEYACESNILKCIFPIHPRTKKMIKMTPKSFFKRIKFIEPVSYLDMINLEKDSRFILTDSGGIQKESYWCQKKCITLRESTEWIETVDLKWNTLVGLSQEKILSAFTKNSMISEDSPYFPSLYGDGSAGRKIIEVLMSHL